MPEINIDKLKQNLSRVAENVIAAGTQAINESMFKLEADFKDRIFQDGLDADGQAIGQYSRKPMYASIEGVKRTYGSQIKSSGLKPRGKNSNKPKFKNGQPRKSQYFPDGYAGFREAVGRQSQKVDLSLTFSLRNDITVRNTPEGTSLTFQDDEQLKKAQGNSNRFGKTIFVTSEAEREAVVETWQDAVADAFFKSFK